MYRKVAKLSEDTPVAVVVQDTEGHVSISWFGEVERTFLWTAFCLNFCRPNKSIKGAKARGNRGQLSSILVADNNLFDRFKTLQQRM